MTMKDIKSKIAIWSLVLSMFVPAFISCVDDFAVGDSFLDKQPGVDVTLDTIFSKAEYARMFLWDNYKYIYNAVSVRTACNAVMPEAISDVAHSILGWGGMITPYYAGMHTEAGIGADKMPFIGNNDRFGIWESIRKSWIFIENIDRVPDMDSREIARLKAEAKLIMATRYFDGICHFGGLPLMDHAYETGEQYTGGYISGIVDEGDFIPGRATLEQTAIFVDNLIQQVIDEPELPFAISNHLSEGGRLSKGGAYALRAKLWLFVASPLFNNAEPYRQYDASPSFPAGFGEDVDPLLRIWWGRKDESLWTKCVEACEKFFEANRNAGTPYALVQPAGNTEADYRRAYRSAYFSRHTTEKIIEVRGEGNGYSDGEYLLEWGANVPGNTSHYGATAPTLEWFNMFPWANGKNFDGQRVYNTANAENLDIFADRDPRLYESMLVPRQNADSYFDYQNKVSDTWEGGEIWGNWWFTSGYMAHGFGQFKWILDYSRMGEERYSYPYLRMADMHLIYAEALAQAGRSGDAIGEVDKVRARVGLPSLSVNTNLNLGDKDVLINEILRERACELAMENSRLLDLIRYKKQDIFTSPLHRMTIYAKDANGEKTKTPFSQMNGVWPKFIYETEAITNYARVWWNGNWDNKWYLSPISRQEINKDYGLSQNPGW